MTWELSKSTELADGVMRWESFGEGPPSCSSMARPTRHSCCVTSRHRSPAMDDASTSSTISAMDYPTKARPGSHLPQKVGVLCRRELAATRWCAMPPRRRAGLPRPPHTRVAHRPGACGGAAAGDRRRVRGRLDSSQRVTSARTGGAPPRSGWGPHRGGSGRSARSGTPTGAHRSRA